MITQSKQHCSALGSMMFTFIFKLKDGIGDLGAQALSILSRASELDRSPLKCSVMVCWRCGIAHHVELLKTKSVCSCWLAEIGDCLDLAFTNVMTHAPRPFYESKNFRPLSGIANLSDKASGPRVLIR